MLGWVEEGINNDRLRWNYIFRDVNFLKATKEKKTFSALEVCTARIFQTGPGTARMATISARPKIKKKNSARARPERKIEI